MSTSSPSAAGNGAGHTAGGRRARRAVAAAVAAVSRGESPVIPPDPTVRHAFVQAARRHRIAPLAHVRLRSTAPDVSAELKPDRDTAMVRHLGAAVTLDSLDSILDEVPWVVFKGPYLSEHAHPVPGLRSYADLDLLVSPFRLREATRRLFAAGWKITDHDAALRYSDTPGESHWLTPSGMHVDLHWSMINMARSRHRFAIDSDGLLARRRTVKIGLTSAWTLDPADTVAHVCVHAALTGADRVLWLIDIDQLARQTVDWDAVVSRAHAWRATAPVALVLQRTRSLLDTPLPADLLNRLGVSRPSRLVAGLADRISPVPTLRKNGSVARLVARAVRPGAGRTLAVVGRNGLQGLKDRIAGTYYRSHGDRRPPDRDALETYLRAVEAEADRHR